MGFYDEVELEDMDWNEELQGFTYSCPCGDLFQITVVCFPSSFWGLLLDTGCTALGQDCEVLLLCSASLPTCLMHKQTTDNLLCLSAPAR